MNVLAALENGLFAIGQVLRLPVMALLWVCVIVAIFLAGSCAIEWVSRQRERRGFDITSWLKQGTVLSPRTDDRQRALPAPLRQLLSAVMRARDEGQLGPGGLEHLVLAHEDQVRRSVNIPRMLVKVGPSLGLLGTLIPMGSSLASLASGNLEAMAGQMVVAFTTTIIGLAAGTVAYIVASVRQNWVSETVREQRFLAERLAIELEAGV